MMVRFLTFILLSGLCLRAGAQGFFDVNTIQEIKLNFAQPDWDQLLDDLKADDDQDFLLVPSVEINGQVFDSVGVKYKGNSSYSPNNAKNPMHIELNYVRKDQHYFGIKDIKLSNCFADPSFVREVLSYEILGRYMDAPVANFSKVWINGTYWGVYINQEAINKRFVRNHFHTDGDNPFFKCNPEDFPGPGTGGNFPNLVYTSTDSAFYYTTYKLESDHGWQELLALMDTLKNHPNSAETLLDLDRALWMLAFNNVLVNLDSYTGAFAQNYYLYQDENARWVPVSWDLNMSFGAFPLLNTGGGGGGLSLAQMQQLDPLAQSANSNRPLIKQLLANPSWKRMYLAHLRTLLQENFAGTAYAGRAAELQAIIDAAVLDDTKKFYTYANFHDNIDQTISGGGGGGGFGAPGLTQLMNARYAFLSGNANLTAIQPVIDNIVVGQAIGNEVWVTADIVNLNAALLGWRYDTASVLRKTAMFDDGQHHDGQANDGVYGGAMSAQSGTAQYYLYAENDGAGIFAPERAEHEFFTADITLATANVGDVVLNEFLASNITGEVDEFGQYDDWLELYNTTSEALSLSGLYLTDRADNAIKWQIPANISIAGNGYLIFWLDENGTQGPFHTNFKLDAAGEFLMLSDGSGLVYDSISFGPQQSDISFGHYPNGTGPFTVMPTTFNAPNSLMSGTFESAETRVRMYPNPVSGSLWLESDAALGDIQVMNALGQPVLRMSAPESTSVLLDLKALPAGIYGVRTGLNRMRLISVIHSK